MKGHLLLLFVLIAPACLIAQNRKYTYDQLFNYVGYPRLAVATPGIEGWADDDQYIQTVWDQSKNQPVKVLVDAVSGNIAPFNEPAHAQPEIEGAKNVTLSPDGKFAAYTKENNLYIMDLSGGKEKAITTDGSETILNGYASWIYYEEILGRASKYKAFWWSPDSKHIAFMRFDDSRVPVFPIYVADGQHGFLEEERYPKAGDKNPEVKIGIASIGGGSITWADFNQADDQYFGTPAWTPTSDFLVQWMNRGQDTLKVYQVNLQNGSKKQLFVDTDRTWIELDDPDRFSFINGSKNFIVKTDRDRWDNLYLYNETGKMISQITKGNFWDTRVLLVNEKSRTVFFRSRKDNAARFDLYRASLDGKAITRMTTGNYSYDSIKISPTGKYFIASYSNISTPYTTAVFDSKGKKIREISTSKGSEFDSYYIPQTRLLAVKSRDGLFDLPMAVTFPQNFDSTKKYPVWISVYGGPNSGTVFDSWKTLTSTFLWFAQEGVIQIAMDNRSSGHFGKKGLDYIFKKLGLQEIEDYIDCAKWIRSQPWADTSRIGITGGSFGGYITCMALTYGSEVFTHGIANYSVTDWRLYDTHYTERFMKQPAQNEEGYRITSPINYAGKYKGLLRIVHGSTDDNVHMQNSIQLIDTLQNLNKHFEMMIYPNQRHGIRPPKADHNTMETVRFVEKYLLGKSDSQPME